MTFYRCGGGGIPSSLKTDMNTVLNKKFGTAIDYPPEGWPDDVNLMGPLPEKTIVSWPIADFNDGADDVPTKAVKISIPPTLSGVSAVTETQTGRNLLLPENADRSVTTVNGIDRSYSLANREFTFSGTNTKTDANWLILNGSNWVVDGIKIGETYRFSHNLTADFYAQFTYNKSGGGVGALGYLSGNAGQNASVSLTIPNDFVSFARFQIGVKNTATTVNIVAHFQLEYGSTAHAYEPYTTPTQYTANLGRTIYGGEVDIVNGTGTDENGNDFTFDGQEVPTRLGYNAFWSDEGDTEVTYRADINLALGGQ